MMGRFTDGRDWWAVAGRLDRLEQLWRDGLSASQICAQLGATSRSAIIGKVHRLGLGRADQKPGEPGKPRQPTVRKPYTRRKPGASITVTNQPFVPAKFVALQPQPEPEPEPELIDDVIPLGQRRTLLELTVDTCRWPIGDPATPDFFYCGGQTAVAKPYCAYHCRVAYQPIDSSRRRSYIPRRDEAA